MMWLFRAFVSHYFGPHCAYEELAGVSVGAAVAEEKARLDRRLCPSEMRMVRSHKVETRQRCAA